MFKTDNVGLAVNKTSVKVSTSVNGSTWATRLSHIKYQSGNIFICTYSLPGLDYIKQIFDKRSSGITLLVNSKFANQAKELKKHYPDLKILTAPNTHAKMVLIYPETVWLSSANLGQSGWFENTIGIKNKDIYIYYENEVKQFILNNNVVEVIDY